MTAPPHVPTVPLIEEPPLLSDDKRKKTAEAALRRQSGSAAGDGDGDVDPLTGKKRKRNKGEKAEEDNTPSKEKTVILMLHVFKKQYSTVVGDATIKWGWGKQCTAGKPVGEFSQVVPEDRRVR